MESLGEYNDLLELMADNQWQCWITSQLHENNAESEAKQTALADSASARYETRASVACCAGFL